MRQIVLQPWFALADLLLVAVSGAAWILIPKFGIWFTLLALLPWVVRLVTGRPAFQRTPFDWLLVIFLITAWIGYWAAYDKTAAWIKVWLIITAILLYYALSAQPKQNFEALSLLSFGIAFGVAVYFFLTFDFASSPGSVALWWMNHRPQVDWHALHHGYTSGLLTITSLFAVYWLQNTILKPISRFTIASKLFLIIGLVLILSAFILTMSRGIWAAGACGLGIWVIWKFITLQSPIIKTRMKSLFPVFVLVYLSAIVLFVYLGPAQASEDSPQAYYGRNSRADVFKRGAYILRDYPILGGGLDSFPGLYSEYMLSIPSFYFINSYNVFLDIAIEQGLIGGLAIILIYIGSVLLASYTIVNAQSAEIRFISWLSLFALVVTIVHGLFYDYLYFSNLTMLFLFPVGFSMIGVRELNAQGDKIVHAPESFLTLNKGNTRIMILVPVLMCLIILAFNINKVMSLWYANLGAVQMSQVELQSFPTNQWETKEIVPQLGAAEASLRSALRYDPANQTANYRLGMISMLRQDFDSASVDLETAHQEAPDYRGITKNLGYSYVWLGELDKAKAVLEQIPEASDELDVYVWWWGTQNRVDLAENAFKMLSQLKASTSAQ